MGDCSNFECNEHAWGKNTRCSRCRHSKIYTCSNCGLELNSNRGIWCKKCIKDRRALQMREIHKNSYAKSKQLNKTITV